MQIIDMEHSKRRKHFAWFSSILDPHCSIEARVDVTNIVLHAKKHQRSFYLEFLYLVMEAVHAVPEMRMRIKGKDAVLFDTIHPSYTIMKNNGVFDTCRHEMSHVYGEFYARGAEAIALRKCHEDDGEEFNDDRIDLVYISSLPWLDVTSMTHPLPLGDHENLSIPRISWGKYTEKDGRYTLTFHITAHHALADGKELCDCILILQKLLDAVDTENPEIQGC